MADREKWQKSLVYTPEVLALARVVLEEVRGRGRAVDQAVRRHRAGGGYLPKHALVAAYRGWSSAVSGRRTPPCWRASA